jgi:glycosyltransferase involved in cell wall biosynthesis
MYPRITYGITVCNEFEELNTLLSTLIPLIEGEDEILILQDITDINNKVTEVINTHISQYPERIRTISSTLNKDFASFKNKLIEHANTSSDYLFQLDADEVPNEFLIENIKSIIAINSQIDVFYIPRVNKVLGITNEHIQKWGWHVDNQQRINYPDLQSRLFKLNRNIYWQNKVHEVLCNHESYTALPFEDHEDFCLYHIKTIEKQEKQNKLYEAI